MRIHKEKNKRIFFNDEEVYFEKFSWRFDR